MVPTVEESLVSIFTSASFLDSLPFVRTTGKIADAALAPAEVFEGTYVRDAEEHELGLFRTAGDSVGDGNTQSSHAESSKAAAARAAHNERDERARHRRSLLGRSTGAGGASGSTNSLSRHTSNNTNINSAHSAWNFPKRSGPARTGPPEKATPLKKKRVTAGNSSSVKQKDINNNSNAAATVDPEVYLKAARKLLNTYPMQRASEHVELLASQYEGLLDSIADLEEALEDTETSASRNRPLNGSSSSPMDDVEALQAEIRREELEILALREAKADLEKKAKSLNINQKTATGNGYAAGGASAKSRTASAGLPKKMPTIPQNGAMRSSAKSSTGSTGSTNSSDGKRVPSVVARRMAEQKLAATIKKDANSSEISGTPTRVAQSHDSRPVPEVQVQSPSLATIDTVNDGAAVDDQDRTITMRSDTEIASAAEPTAQAQRRIEPRLPMEQLQKLVIKMSIALPSYKIPAPREAEGMLTALSDALTAGGPSPKQAASGTLNSPGSASISPVHIIEIYLLHTFLSLLLSLTPVEAADSPQGVHGTTAPTLILRDVTSSSPATSKKQMQQEPLLNMNSLKVYLAGRAKERGYNEDLGHKAIYGLVAKRVLKIDRKGREALVCFT